MAKFMTRVELHMGTEEQYKKLHAAMERQGFKRTITGKDGVVYHLPTAEYSFEGSQTLPEVRKTAWDASGRISSSRAVLVTEGISMWDGLARV